MDLPGWMGHWDLLVDMACWCTGAYKTTRPNWTQQARLIGPIGMMGQDQLVHRTCKKSFPVGVQGVTVPVGWQGVREAVPNDQDADQYRAVDHSSGPHRKK